MRRFVCCNDTSSKSFVGVDEENNRATVVLPYKRRQVRFCVGKEKLVELSEELVF